MINKEKRRLNKKEEIMIVEKNEAEYDTRLAI